MSSSRQGNEIMSHKLRKKWLIYPKFQLTIILANVATSLIACLFAVYEICKSFEGMRENIRAAGFLPDHPYYKALDDQLNSIMLGLGTALMLTVIISIIFSLFISQRLVGPIYRLQQYLEARRSNKGKSTAPLSFRKGDYFEDLPDLVNSALNQSPSID